MWFHNSDLYEKKMITNLAWFIGHLPCGYQAHPADNMHCGNVTLLSKVLYPAVHGYHSAFQHQPYTGGNMVLGSFPPINWHRSLLIFFIVIGHTPMYSSLLVSCAFQHIGYRSQVGVHTFLPVRGKHLALFKYR